MPRSRDGSLNWALLPVVLALAACPCGSKVPAAAPSGESPSAESVRPPALPGLDASTLIKPDEIAAWLPAGSVLRPLVGATRSPTYDGIRWGISGSRDLGLTVQWWRFGTQGEAESRFDKNLAGAPGAQSGTELGPRSFRAPAYQHRELCFVEATSHSVVEIGCGDATCVGEPGAAHMLELARLIRARLGG